MRSIVVGYSVFVDGLAQVASIGMNTTIISLRYPLKQSPSAYALLIQLTGHKSVDTLTNRCILLGQQNMLSSTRHMSYILIQPGLSPSSRLPPL